MVVKNPPTNAEDARDASSIPGPGRYPEVGNGNTLQVFLLGKSHGQRSLMVTVHRVSKSGTRLGNRAHTHIMTSITFDFLAFQCLYLGLYS